MEARLKTSLWVAAALRTAQTRGAFGAVLRKGDPDAGGVLVVLRNRGVVSVLSQARTAEGEPAWIRPLRSVTENAADSYIARRVSMDPDLWVVEFESADETPPFSDVVLDPLADGAAE